MTNTRPECTPEVVILKTISDTSDPDKLASIAGQYMDEIRVLANTSATCSRLGATYERLLQAVRNQQLRVFNRNGQQEETA